MRFNSDAGLECEVLFGIELSVVFEVEAFELDNRVANDVEKVGTEWEEYAAFLQLQCRLPIAQKSLRDICPNIGISEKYL